LNFILAAPRQYHDGVQIHSVRGHSAIVSGAERKREHLGSTRFARPLSQEFIMPTNTYANLPLAEQLLQALDALSGLHPGHRPAHAKGLMCSGEFKPSREAQQLTRAPHASRWALLQNTEKRGTEKAKKSLAER
jgi:hypothetical protein